MKSFVLNPRRTIERNGDDVFDYEDMEKELIDHMAGINFKDVHTVVINPFDYHDVYNAVIKIAAEETESNSKVKFHINFTLGTNVMAGAVCSAAYPIDADLYYIKSSRYILGNDGQDDLISISIANYREIDELKRQKRTADVLQLSQRELVAIPNSYRHYHSNRMHSLITQAFCGIWDSSRTGAVLGI